MFLATPDAVSFGMHTRFGHNIAPLDDIAANSLADRFGRTRLGYHSLFDESLSGVTCGEELIHLPVEASQHW